MEYIRNFIVGLITGITAYLNPINGEIQSLLAVFFLNFVFGLLTALLANGEHFSFKKAWKCVLEATVLFVLICSIYFIGEHKGNAAGALQCVSFITYSVFYFYGVNIFRNLTILLPDTSIAYKVVSFIYYIISVEFVKKIPHLQEYLSLNAKSDEGK